MTEIYTDGAASMFLTDAGYERGPGAWAWCYVEDELLQNESYGNKQATTNQEMELYAIYQALLFIGELKPSEVNLYSDSQYSISIYTAWAKSWEKNGWKRKGNKEIVNLEVIKKTWSLLAELQRQGIKVNFKKVAGHSTNKWNNYVDKLAVNAKQELL